MNPDRIDKALILAYGVSASLFLAFLILTLGVAQHG